MKQTNTTNRRLVLVERHEGAPTESTLRLETEDVPSPQEGELLLRTEFLLLDPYMRGRMSDAPSYAPPVNSGEVMVGATVAIVLAALAMTMESTHVLGLPQKMDYDARMYSAVNGSIEP